MAVTTVGGGVAIPHAFVPDVDQPVVGAMHLKRAVYLYACPMHPGVTGRSAEDACWTCGMKLKKSAGDASSADPSGHSGGHGGHKH